jgi:PAS domain S-box-containing protein
MMSASVIFGSLAALSIALILFATALLTLRERLGDAEGEAAKAGAMLGLFRAAFEHCSLATVQSMGRDGRITLWNHACEKVFGYGRAEAEGKSALDLLVGDGERARFVKMLDRIWETKLALPPVEMELLRKDGSKATVLMQLMPITHDGEVTEAMLIAIDVSSRHEAMKKAEDKVNELKNLQERLLAREGRMIELKKEINSLLERLGEQPKYVT